MEFVAGMMMGLGVGGFICFLRTSAEDADAAVADEKPLWWRKALIDAEARKRKAEERP